MSDQPSILLMDEDAETLEQLQTVLQREGYKVFVAADGIAALRLATMSSPDLIVSDVLLAGLDGYEVWHKLRASQETADIPILVTSALNIPPKNQAWRPTPDAEWRVLQYDAALPKPIDLPRFVRVVKRLLMPDQVDTIPSGPSVIIGGTDSEITMSLASLLRLNGFGVRTPGTLSQALQITKSIPHAALILDYHKPNAIIKDIIWQAKDFAPNTILMLIISSKQDISPEIQVYCDGYLTLPFHPLHTMATLNQTLEIHITRRRAEALSSNLLTVNRDLLGTQQALRAQNKELTQTLNIQHQRPESKKSAFTGLVVHDLKSPLGSILGTLNFLKTDPDLDFSDMTKNLITGSVAAGNQMLRLIETLLEGQRLANDDAEMYSEPFDTKTVIDMALEQIRTYLALHQLEIECEIADNLPLAYADLNITQRIIENLLDNAIKYSASQSVIKLRASQQDKFIAIHIEDSGTGIPADQVPYVFDRLALTEKIGRDAVRPGFGLGLTFCKLAAEASGGTIGVDSPNDDGATFYFTIPIFEDQSE